MSTVIGSLTTVFGLNATTIFGFIALATLELITGIYSSVVVQKQDFESSKIGRFTFKLAIWLILIWILNAYRKDFKEASIIAQAFDYIFYASFTWISFEYLVSVAENMAVIKGKPKNYYVSFFKDKVTNLLKSTKLPILFLLLLVGSGCARKITRLNSSNSSLVLKDSSNTVKQDYETNENDVFFSDKVSYIDTSFTTEVSESKLTTNQSTLYRDTTIEETTGNSTLTLTSKDGIIKAKCKCDSIELKAKIMQREIVDLKKIAKDSRSNSKNYQQQNTILIKEIQSLKSEKTGRPITSYIPFWLWFIAGAIVSYLITKKLL